MCVSHHSALKDFTSSIDHAFILPYVSEACRAAIWRRCRGQDRPEVAESCQAPREPWTALRFTPEASLSIQWECKAKVRQADWEYQQTADFRKPPRAGTRAHEDAFSYQCQRRWQEKALPTDWTFEPEGPGHGWTHQEGPAGCRLLPTSRGGE